VTLSRLCHFHGRRLKLAEGAACLHRLILLRIADQQNMRAVLVRALQMRKLNIKKLPLYPEERACAAPTTERLFELFEDLRRHRLLDKGGHVHQRFYDEPSEPQRAVLRLFKLSRTNTCRLRRRVRRPDAASKQRRKLPGNQV
jgi:hypothetical protein